MDPYDLLSETLQVEWEKYNLVAGLDYLIEHPDGSFMGSEEKPPSDKTIRDASFLWRSEEPQVDEWLTEEEIESLQHTYKTARDDQVWRMLNEFLAKLRHDRTQNGEADRQNTQADS